MINADRFYSQGEALTRDGVAVQARLMPGQVVIPKQLLEREASLVEHLTQSFQQNGLQLRAFTIGSDAMPRDDQSGIADFTDQRAVAGGTILTACMHDLERVDHD